LFKVIVSFTVTKIRALLCVCGTIIQGFNCTSSLNTVIKLPDFLMVHCVG